MTARLNSWTRIAMTTSSRFDICKTCDTFNYVRTRSHTCACVVFVTITMIWDSHFVIQCVVIIKACLV